MTKKEKITVILFTVGLSASFYWLQKQVLFSPDVSYLIHAANQLLQGGHYATDIFETNPPMILYLYMPIIGLTKLIPLSINTATYVYMFLLTLISAMVCLYLLKRLMKESQDYRLSLFFCGLLCVFIIFPVVMFAQREHLLLIFMFPYLLCAALRLDNKPINPWLAIGVGVFAGLGFSIKPYFLAAPCLIEFLFILQKRKLFAWVRIESLSIISVLILYLITIFIFQPGYLTIVLPLVSKYYFFVIKQPWFYMLSMGYVNFTLIIAVIYTFYGGYDNYSHLGRVIYAALLGMIAAFIISQNVWYYHVYPALSLAFLLMLHGFSQVSIKRKVYLTAIIFLGFICFAEYKIFNVYFDFKKMHSRNDLSKLFNKLSGDHTLTCFTPTGTASCFPMVSEINHGKYQGRFPFFWWYTGLSFIEKNNKHDVNTLEADKKNFINAIASDLNRYHTRWIIVDMKAFERRESSGFNIISFLAMNDNFNAAFSHYVFYAKVNDYDLYIRKSGAL